MIDPSLIPWALMGTGLILYGSVMFWIWWSHYRGPHDPDSW